MGRLAMVGVILLVLFTACSDPIERPVADSGQIITVVDEDTPGLPKSTVLEDLAVGPDGTLYLAQSAVRNVVVAVPLRGRARVLADTDERSFPEPGGFLPVALALDPESGTLYIADQGGGWIRAVDTKGRRRNVIRIADGFDAKPSVLRGLLGYLAFDPVSKGLYAADQCQVAHVKGGKAVVVAGLPGCGRVPRDPALALFGEGVPATAGLLEGVYGLAVDPNSGDLVVAVEGPSGSVLGEVFRVDDEGRVTKVLEGKNAPAYRIRDEVNLRRRVGGGLAFHPLTGALYVADPVQGIIRRVSRDGKVETVAGTEPEREATGDGGPARRAGLNGPARLAVDEAGNVYVNGSLRARTVRMIGAEAP